jgi:hypothetical protein
VPEPNRPCHVPGASVQLRDEETTRTHLEAEDGAARPEALGRAAVERHRCHPRGQPTCLHPTHVTATQATRPPTELRAP